MEQGEWLTEIAVAVADGKVIDWAPIEARPLSVDARAILQRLRLLEQVVRVHGVSPHEPPASVADVPGPAEAPATWGPLTIRNRIGTGTFGDVYRAHDRHLDRPVALKLLRRREQEGDTFGSTVITEARLLAKIQHANVVTVYGAERIDGQVGFWMELVEGETLEDIRQSRGAFEPDAVLHIGMDLCAALDAVHKAGLLHRDVKAQNVMRTSDGRIVLTDFGAGRDLVNHTAPAAALAGTPFYIAPEILEGEPASVQSEVYGLGVLLFYLSTGTFPVRGDSVRNLRDAHARRERTALRAARPGFPKSFANAIERAIHPDPSRRYHSTDEFNHALQTLTARRRTIRRRVLVSLNVGGYLLLMAVIAFLFLSLQSSRRVFQHLQRFMQGRSAPTGPLAQFSQLDTATWRGRATPIAVPSNDGWMLCVTNRMTLAKCHTTDGNIQDLALTDQRAITSVAEARQVYLLSPKGDQLAYAGTSGVRVTSLESGKNILVASQAAADSLPIAWAADESFLVLAERTARTPSHYTLTGVSVTTRERVVLVDLGTNAPGSGNISPDGRRLAYDVVTGAHSSTVRLLDLESRADVPLGQRDAWNALPMWNDARGLAFLSAGDTAHAWSVDVDGTVVSSPVNVQDFPRGLPTPIGVTRRGAITYLLDEAPAMYVGSMNYGTLFEPKRISGQLLQEIGPIAWSPFGDSLAFLSNGQVLRRGFAGTDAANDLTIFRVADRSSRQIENVGTHILGVRWLDDGNGWPPDPWPGWQLSICCGADGREHVVDGLTGKILARPEPGTARFLPLGSALVERSEELYFWKERAIWRRDLRLHQDVRFADATSTLAAGTEELFTTASGDWLGFVRSQNGRQFIRLLSRDGVVKDVHSSSERLSIGGWINRDTRLVFLEGGAIKMMTLQTGSVTVVEVGMDNVSDLRTSPDGTLVAFRGVDRLGPQLWELTLLRR